jgi:hypothetical protein
VIAPARRPIVAPVDLTRFLVAFGLVPLLFAREFERDVPPWSFALTPSWATGQLVFIALAGAVLGVTSSRPAHGVAAVALGVLLGLVADLWWFASWVKPYDQTFVTMLPHAEWRSRLTVSALALLGSVSAGFVVGAVVSRLVPDPTGFRLRRPTSSEAVAFGLALVGGPILALGIVLAAASSALVVPVGAQVETVSISAGSIAVDPAILRPGSTRFRCQFAVDAAPGWASLVAVPEGGDLDPVAPSVDEASCGFEPGTVTWGTIADLQPGRYVWKQLDLQSEVARTIAISPVVIVSP